MKFCIRLTLFALSILLISSNVVAQKIKIKKDILYIDKQKTPIAVDIMYETVENMGDFHQVYTFTDTTTNKVFLYADFKGYSILGINEKLSWLEISDAKRSKTNSVDFKGGLFSSKNKVVLALLNKYQFFNHEGVVNHQKINEFLASSTQSVVKEQATKELEKADKLREFKPYVTLDSSIRQGGLKGDVIGRLELPENKNSMGFFTYSVYDLDDNEIASASIEPSLPVVEVSLIDGKRFEYNSRFGLQIGSKLFLEELIGHLFLRNYNLGHQYNEISIASDAEADLAN